MNWNRDLRFARAHQSNFHRGPIIGTINAWQECNANTRDNMDRIDERYSLWRAYSCSQIRAKFTFSSILESFVLRKSFHSEIFVLSSRVKDLAGGKNSEDSFRRKNFLTKKGQGLDPCGIVEGKFEKINIWASIDMGQLLIEIRKQIFHSSSKVTDFFFRIQNERINSRLISKRFFE